MTQGSRMLAAATVQSQKETLGKGHQQMTGFARAPGNDPFTQTRESSKVGSGEPVTREQGQGTRSRVPAIFCPAESV